MFGMPTYLAFTSRLVPRAEIPPRATVPRAASRASIAMKARPMRVIMGPFVSPLGLPCQAPPWGYVAGADLRTGKIT